MMSLAYRPDIDGLRAIAVGSVVLFHGGFPLLHGGFVGVDVFFVISGFLITSIMADNMERRRFSIVDFYDRRIRRIFPALFVVLVATTLLSTLVMLPKQMDELGQSLIPAIFFYANVHFMGMQSYFAPAAEGLPLLHLWSLAVEEQFYIGFPLILFILMRLGGRRLAVGGLLLVALGSLALAQIELQEAPRRAFFLLSSRAWELLVGSLLALAPLPAVRPRVGAWLGALGLAALLLPIFLYSRSTSFPGIAALPPVLGAALIIYSGRHAGAAPVARALSLPGMVYVGRISYSLYLWHWPLLALAYVYRGRGPTTLLALGLIAIAVVLSALSLRYVELPARRADLLGGKRRARFAAAAVAMLLIACSALLIDFRGGRVWPLSARGMEADAAIREPMLKGFCTPNEDFMRGSKNCIVPPAGGGEGYKVLVWGDSHASASFSGFSHLLSQEGIGSRLLALHGCPPLIGVSTPHPSPDETECAVFNSAVLKEIQAHPPKLVLLVSRWALWTTHAGPALALTMPDLPAARKPTGEGSRAAFPVALRRTVEAIRKAGAQVLVVGQVPEFRVDPAECLIRAEYFGGDSARCVSESLEQAEKFTGSDTKEIKKVVQEVPGTGVLFLSGLFCDAAGCAAATPDELLYRDTNHLTLAGARRIQNSALVRETILALLNSEQPAGDAPTRSEGAEGLTSTADGGHN